MELDTSACGVGLGRSSPAAGLCRGVTRVIPLVRRFVALVVVVVAVVPVVDLRRGIFEGDRSGSIVLVEVVVDGSGAVTGLSDDRRRFGGISMALIEVRDPSPVQNRRWARLKYQHNPVDSWHSQP